MQTPAPVAESPQQGQSPFLGLYVDPDEPETLGDVVPLRYKGQKSLLTFGVPGANKSMGLVVPNLVMLRRSCIVIDPKGQLCAITKRAREKMGRVIVLNPFDELFDVRRDMESTGWNPLAQLDPESDDFGSDARSLGEAVIDKTSNSKGEFFETSMENLWTVFCMWERLQEGAKASLCNVRETLAELSGDDASFLATLKAMSESDRRGIRIPAKRLYNRLTDKKSQANSLQDVIETVMKNTAFLDDPRIEYDMRPRTEKGVGYGGAIPFEKMHDEIITVFVVIPLGQLEKQAKWLRMFVKLAFASLFRTPPRVAKLPPVLFILDEFGNLGRIPEVVNALNVARDYRIQCWFFLQYFHQLKKLYPDEWPAFFAGSGAVTTFNTGDLETAKHFSDLFGKREVTMSSYNTGNGGMIGGGTKSPQISSGETRGTQLFPYIAPEDLARLGKGRTLSRIEPCPWPVTGEARGYWEILSPALVDPNPYFHG